MTTTYLFFRRNIGTLCLLCLLFALIVSSGCGNQARTEEPRSMEATTLPSIANNAITDDDMRTLKEDVKAYFDGVARDSTLRDREKFLENRKRFLEEKSRNRFDVWKDAAEKGIPEGQILLGLCYRFGVGVPENMTEEANWYRKAAEQGHAEAQFFLGGCYEVGDGVPENKAEAVQWYRKAAEQGHANNGSNSTS